MYTIDEFCKIFRITRQTFYNWVSKGLVNVVKVDRIVRITEEEVNRLKGGEQDAEDTSR